MARLRTIDKCVEELHEIDRGSAITKYGLRRAIKTKEIPAILISGRYLVDLDFLLNLQPQSARPDLALTSDIRRIPERQTR